MMAGDVIRGPWPGSGQERPVGSENHPAGRQRASDAAPRDLEFRWRSRFPSTTEQRRAALLAAKPRCVDCERLFAPRVDPPRDLLCRDCRTARALAQEPPIGEDDRLF